MICIRCKMAVEAVLQANEIAYHTVELGRAELQAPLSAAQQKALVTGLAHYHLEVMHNRNTILVEGIKTEITNLLQAPHAMHLKLSAHLSQTLGYNYTYLANTFSEQEGMTLEKYFICQRIERVKELIVYEDLSLTQISDELAYSSVSHLCLQFKKVTGFRPAEFKKCLLLPNFIWRPV